MSEPGAGLNRDVLEDFRLARRARAVLEGAGFPLALWEGYALAHRDPAALRREIRRLERAGPSPELHSEFLSALRVLRDQAGATLRRMRRFLPQGDAERQEMLLALVAASAPALEAAARWADEPVRHEAEAAKKIRLMEGIVDRYGAVLDGPAVEPPAAPAAPAAAPPPEPGLPVPPGFTAAPGHGEVALSWFPVPGAASYVVKRAIAPEGPFLPVARPTAPAFVDTGLANGLAYHYLLTAVDAAGSEGRASPAVPATPVAPPSAPEGLEAAPGNAQVALSWKPSPRAASYVLRRASAPGGPFAAVGACAAPPWTDTGLSNGATYHYTVSALNPGGESPASVPVSAAPVVPPPAPFGLTAAPGHARVALAWLPVPRATGYNVRRSTSRGGPYVTIASPSEPSFVDGGLRNGTSCYYVVTALNAGGESTGSGEVSSQPVAPPPPPAGLAVFAGNAQVALSWKPVEGALRYRVRRATSPAGPFTVHLETERTGAVDASVANGTAYAYVVSALNLGGEGPVGPPLVALPMAPPAGPSGLIAVPGNAKVSLSWTPSPRAARYSVRRSGSPSGPFAQAGECEPPSFVDSGLPNGGTCYYVVVASNVGGESPPSAPAAATPVAPPAPPEGLGATPGNAQVALAWSASPGAVGYRVKRASSVEGPYVPIAATAEFAWVDATAANGTAFFYAVSAVNAGGESSDSAAAEATPQAPPPAPGSIEARAGDGGVTLAWPPSERAARYYVRRATNPGGPFAEIAAPLEPGYLDRAVTNGTTYYYRVSSENAGGASPESPRAEAMPVEAPPAPAGFTATPGNAQVTLAWAASPRAAGYRVRRATDFKGPYATVAETPATSYVDTGIVNGQAYSYYVVAFNAGGESKRCSRKRAHPVAPPEAPAGLAAFAGNGHVDLSWEASPGAARYRVRRAAERRGPYVPLATVGGTSWTDEAVANGTTYHYLVTAMNAGGKSRHTAPVAAMPLAPPRPPAVVEAAAGNGRVTLSWPACEGAAGYRVMRSEAPGGPYTIVSGPAATTYLDAPLQNGRSYHYVVTAVNPGGESGRSPEAAATPLAPPSAPTGLEAQAGDSRVALAWAAVETAVGYTVKRATLPGGPYLPVAHPIEPRYTDTGVVNGKPFYYVVCAVIPSGEGPDSLLVPAVPEEAVAPGMPTPTPPGPFPPPQDLESRQPIRVGAAAGGAAAEDVPALESLNVPAVGTLPVGVDLERLLDLKRVEQVRAIFDGTTQKIESWEVLCLIAREGYSARRDLERLVRLREKGEEARLNDGALAFFDKILQVRTEQGGFARRLSAYLDGLDLGRFGRPALEIALGFILSAPRGRQRAERWLEDPEGQRRTARTYLEHALQISLKYHSQLSAK